MAGSFSIRTFFRSSLRRQLWLLLFCTILGILLATTITTSQVIIGHSRENAAASSEKLVYQGSENLQNYLNEIRNASLIPYSNSTLYRLLSSTGTHVYELDSYISLALKSAAAGSVYQVFLYTDNIQTGYLLQGYYFDKSSLIYESTGGPLYLEPVHESRNYGVTGFHTSAKSEQVVTLHRRLSRVPEDTYMGDIAIDLKTDYLLQVMDNMRSGEAESVYLFDENRTLLISSGAEEDGGFEWLAAIPDDASDGVLTTKEAGAGAKIVIYKTMKMETQRLLLVKTIAAEALTSDAAALIRINWFTAFVCLVIASVFANLLARRFTTPIQYLHEHMERIGSGDMTEQITTNRIDEIGSLYRYFQTMMDNINDLIRQRYELELSDKNHQLMALQAQLNPHFINNTIQSIGTAALENGSQDIYEQLASFGSMMQYCMDFRTRTVPISEELRYVENYLGFQKARFAGRFVYSINMPDGLGGFLIPKMLIQPLVENSFKHGKIQERTNGFVLVVTEFDEKSVSVTVSDNGCGADEGTLAALRRSIGSADESGAGSENRDADEAALSNTNRGHIGLMNTYSRIHLHYGAAAQLAFGNRGQGGFEVRITLPRLEEGQNESADC